MERWFLSVSAKVILLGNFLASLGIIVWAFDRSAISLRLMKAQTVGDTSSLDFMRGRRVCEINPDHPIVQNLNDTFRNSPNDEDTLRAIDLLYDTALLSSGFTPENSAELGGKICEMMGTALSGEWSVAHQSQHTGNQHASAGPQTPSGTVEDAEIVEPAETGSRK